MSLSLHHECTRVPVTALASSGRFLFAAEGPLLRIYCNDAYKLLTTIRIFQDQTIHGIAIAPESVGRSVLLLWGGSLVRALQLPGNELTDNSAGFPVRLSPTLKVPDWILYLSFGPAEAAQLEQCEGKCIAAAVTAHNALIQLSVDDGSSLKIRAKELTSSSRCILYSAHLCWDSPDLILVAAGTAFGEIVLWSWMRSASFAKVHNVFLGHEGSVFGVQISDVFQEALLQGTKRLLASCSDDRTVMLWDISNVSASASEAVKSRESLEAQRERHTGFSNALLDSEERHPSLIATARGHSSRVWSVNFLQSHAGKDLLSLGEDATSRLWQFGPFEVSQQDRDLLLYETNIAADHSGKSLWSMAICSPTLTSQEVVTGGADSKITAYNLPDDHPDVRQPNQNQVDISRYDADNDSSTQEVAVRSSSKKSDFFRSYAFVDECSYILTTNSGKVYLESVNTLHKHTYLETDFKSYPKLVGDLYDLRGYSICTGISQLGMVVLAGACGTVYIYQQYSAAFSALFSVTGKVGGLFVAPISGTDVITFALLVTLVGQRSAQLLIVNLNESGAPSVLRTWEIAISNSLTGLVLTSMSYISTAGRNDYVLGGFRGGSIAAYALSNKATSGQSRAIPFRIMERVHGKEAVTAMLWIPRGPTSAVGDLISVGRNGSCAIHHADLAANSFTVVHDLPLPIGQNIEGLQISYRGHLTAHGFSSSRFILYDITVEEEVMSVDTGGAHRSWTFEPGQSSAGGMLVWTRASTMHVCHQPEPNHKVIRSGGHGREIKAVAVSPMITSGRLSRKLIATGAEDTDIKIFEYQNNELKCLRTLRKHTTGIQALKWSEDGDYLFSSGGCEEFYIWRVRPVGCVGIGVVCEAVCTPESEHSDLRIMGFDIRKGVRSTYTITLVFSNSPVRVYVYDPSAAVKWLNLANGTYFTSCLTQCAFLGTETIITAGTDGHAVFWRLPSPVHPTTSTDQDKIKWQQPVRIHQNSSKSLALYQASFNSTLFVSGGDDCSLAFLLASPSSTPDSDAHLLHPPIIIPRAHASAITTCALFSSRARILLLTCGNDQWVRLWQLSFRPSTSDTQEAENTMQPIGAQDWLDVKRITKVKTSVADVSSMVILEESDIATKVLICGVGMEIIRIEG